MKVLGTVLVVLMMSITSAQASGYDSKVSNMAKTMVAATPGIAVTGMLAFTGDEGCGVKLSAQEVGMSYCLVGDQLGALTAAVNGMGAKVKVMGMADGQMLKVDGFEVLGVPEGMQDMAAGAVAGMMKKNPVVEETGNTLEKVSEYNAPKVPALN